ncbi:hypothetical protein FHW89_001731 [Mucilaginibacter sp. SG564]|nr:hypothetical protein [Mucilaginibacter sp. SG564]
MREIESVAYEYKSFHSDIQERKDINLSGKVVCAITVDDIKIKLPIDLHPNYNIIKPNER